MPEQAAPAAAKSARKRLQIFHAQDARPLGEDRMPTVGMDEAKQADLARAMGEITPGAGERATVLFSEPGEHGMSLVYGWFKSGYPLPPHSHDSDCLYYVLAGELRIGAHVLRKGDGMFIPGGHGYAYEAGPEGVEVLEFRNATRFNIDLSAAGTAHWERMAAAYRDRAGAWASETIPPSQR